MSGMLYYDNAARHDTLLFATVTLRCIYGYIMFVIDKW